MRNRIIFSITVLGFTAMCSQIVLMRELMIIFYGNELSLGITLGSWLFWTGFGSLVVAGNSVRRIKNKTSVFAGLLIVLAFILPINILAVRLMPSVLNFSPGEIIDVYSMAVSTFLLLAPLCVISGFLFVLGCGIFPGVSGGARSIGWVYILEAVGSAFGGLLTSIFLVRFFDSLHIMAILTILNIVPAILISRPMKKLFYASLVVFIAFISFIISGGMEFLQKNSLKRQWRSYEILAAENSIYGNIVVAQRHSLYSIFANGLYNFSIPDEFTSEKKAHLPLLEHPAPEYVLLIGGGAGGILKEVLKHPVQHVDYVELDPLIIKLSETLPGNKALREPRVKIISNMDGRLFVKKADKKYDVLLMNLPGPHTAQINRFYTQEFFREAKGILKPGGILSFSLPSNPNYISRDQLLLYLSLKKTLENVFDEVEVTPGGGVSFFFASNQKGVISLDWRKLMDRLKERKIQTKYVRGYYLFSDFSNERIQYLTDTLSNAEVSQKKNDIINRDFHPVAYYYDIIFWSTHFKHSLKKMFQTITPKRVYISVFLICLILLAPVFIKKKNKTPAWAILSCMGTTGFAEMSIQIITLLAFQALYGYVFYKLGIVMTSYMAGLILGAWFITKKIDKSDYALFVKTQAAIFVYPLVLSLLFLVLSMSKTGFSFWLGSNFLPFLPVIAGFIGGFQFPLANSLYMKIREATDTGLSAGLTYGVDILGACAGTILTSVILIPVIGIQMSCVLIAILNLAGLILIGDCPWELRKYHLTKYTN